MKYYCSINLFNAQTVQVFVKKFLSNERIDPINLMELPDKSHLFKNNFSQYFAINKNGKRFHLKKEDGEIRYYMLDSNGENEVLVIK